MKEKDYKATGSVGGPAQDDKKMVKNYKLKAEKFKKYVNYDQRLFTLNLMVKMNWCFIFTLYLL